MRRIGGERRWWKVLVPALPGLATDIGQRLAEHRALEWGNEMIGEYAGPYLKPALLWLWQNPMYWTLAPPVMYLLWVNRRLSEQDMMDEDRERITAGWLSRELETRGYDPKQLAYVADSCVARLETHHLDTKAAARRLFDDARTRADVERLYLQELPRTRNETNVRDALGLCAWGPPIHRASPRDRARVLDEIARAIAKERPVEEHQALAVERPPALGSPAPAQLLLPSVPAATDTPGPQSTRGIERSPARASRERNLIHDDVRWTGRRNDGGIVVVTGPYCRVDGAHLSISNPFGARQLPEDGHTTGGLPFPQALVCPECSGRFLLSGQFVTKTIGASKAEACQRLEELIPRLPSEPARTAAPPTVPLIESAAPLNVGGRLALQFVESAPPFRQEMHLPDETRRLGQPTFDVFFNVKLFLSRGATVDDIAVTLEVCLPDDGNDDGAFDLQLLPQPLQERSDNPPVGQPYKTRFSLRRNQELFFRVLRWRSAGPDARFIYACLATHHTVVGVPVGTPPKLYRLLVRATSEHGVTEQWLSARMVGGLEVKPLPAPELRHITPEILDELADLLTKAWEARPLGFTGEPASVNKEFLARINKLRSRFETLRTRLDDFTQQMFDPCIKAMAYGHARLCEVPSLAESQRGRAVQEATMKLAEVTSHRQGINRWFTIARRLMSDAADRGRLDGV